MLPRSQPQSSQTLQLSNLGYLATKLYPESGFKLPLLTSLLLTSEVLRRTTQKWLQRVSCPLFDSASHSHAASQDPPTSNKQVSEVKAAEHISHLPGTAPHRVAWQSNRASSKTFGCLSLSHLLDLRMPLSFSIKPPTISPLLSETPLPQLPSSGPIRSRLNYKRQLDQGHHSLFPSSLLDNR